MMARSTKGSNQRPDTLMQDRKSAVSIKVLLQRTAGPYIWVNRFTSTSPGRPRNVRFTPNSDRTFAPQRNAALCQQRNHALQQTTCTGCNHSLDQLVGAEHEMGGHIETERARCLQVEDELEFG